MKQVKIISAVGSTELEKAVNAFIEHKTVLNVQFSINTLAGGHVAHYAFVLYEA